jgi:hypothetical protein
MKISVDTDQYIEQFASGKEPLNYIWATEAFNKGMTLAI